MMALNGHSQPGFIFFDLGNVIVEFSHSRAAEQMAALTGVEVERVQSCVFESGLQNQYESGLVDCDQFHEAFCSETGTKPERDALLLANSDIFWLNRTIVPVITALRAANWPIGILSNTCPAHWNFVLKEFPIVRFCFSKWILSYESKSMKPDAKIYEDAIAMANVPPEQVFFVDDKPENILAASHAGMDAHVFESTAQLLDLFCERNVNLNC